MHGKSVIVGGLLVALLGGCSNGDAGERVTVFRGRAALVSNINDETATVAFDVEDESGPGVDDDLVRSFDVGVADWFDGRTWHEHGIPDCLSKNPVPVSAAFIQVAPEDDAPGSALLAWLRCE